MANASRLGQPRLVVPIQYEREYRQPWATAAPAATTASLTTTSIVLYSLRVASAEVAAVRRPIMLVLNRVTVGPAGYLVPSGHRHRVRVRATV